MQDAISWQVNRYLPIQVVRLCYVNSDALIVAGLRLSGSWKTAGDETCYTRGQWKLRQVFHGRTKENSVEY